MFDIGKYTFRYKVEVHLGLCVPYSYKSKDVEDLFDIGKYTGGIKLKLTWGLCVPDSYKSKVSRICLI